MTRKISAIIAATITTILIVPSIGMVYATEPMIALDAYFGNVGSEGQTGANTLEETLKIAQNRIALVEQSTEKGSGTPVLAPDGVLGASLISATVFGGIATAFFVKSKGGRYVEPGTG